MYDYNDQQLQFFSTYLQISVPDLFFEAESESASGSSLARIVFYEKRIDFVEKWNAEVITCI